MTLADEVRSFTTLARSYCTLIDSLGRLDPHSEDVRTCARLLAHLVDAALALPDAEPSEDHTIRRASSPALAAGESDVYLEVFDAYDLDAEPVHGSLVDDLRDVYLDLGVGLIHVDQGRPQDAAWEWRARFSSHWGEHATSALRALYWLLRRAAP